MAAIEKIKLLSSSISHMPLHFVFRDSGVAAKHGFELDVDIAKVPQIGKQTRSIRERATLLLSGQYQFLSGLHHEPYLYRARGDKRLPGERNRLVRVVVIVVVAHSALSSQCS